MTTSCRSWWRNCAQQTDPAIVDIDAMEDRIAPISVDTSEVRELIASLELCHHKAERWIDNIVQAIGAGTTEKGLGTRPPGEVHPAAAMWFAAITAALFSSLIFICHGRSPLGENVPVISALTVFTQSPA